MLSEAFDDIVGLQAGQGDVGEPEAEQEATRQVLEDFWTAQLATNAIKSPKHHHYNADEGSTAEDGDVEGQAVNRTAIRL